ncbi:MAG: acyl-protein synthetase [Limisphaerales bacterium]
MSDPLSAFAHRLLPEIRGGDGRGNLPFDDLALELFRIQWDRNAAYRRLAEASGVSARAVRSWQEIPAVPTLAFKELEMTALAPSERLRVFHSSGTTGQVPSRHHHGAESLALYEASVEAGFESGFWAGSATALRPVERQPGRTGWTPISLTPPADSVPHSSLVHMIEHLGSTDRAATRTRYVGRVSSDGAWELDGDRVLAEWSAARESGRPVVLFGTAFNHVHLIELLERETMECSLPAGSRILETGGYKGRSREWTKPALRSAISRCLGVKPEAIVGEYGMSELSSQAYEGPLRLALESGNTDPAGADRAFVFPAWVRPLVVSPETGRPARDGEPGLLRILDLANVWSAMAVQTGDRAVRRPGGGIELLGRAPAAEPRGCSLMAA